MPSHFWRAVAWLLRRSSNDAVWKVRFAADDEIHRRAQAAGDAWDQEHGDMTNEAFGV